MTIDTNEVLTRLRKVKGPDLSGNIVDLGLVSEIVVRGDRVVFSVMVPADRAAALEPLRAAAAKAAGRAEGVAAAVVTLTAARSELSGGKPLAPDASAPVALPGEARPTTGKIAPIPGIGAIVAVASGKGGVGKSTTSVNLALALQASGLRVGILDADIHGPSIPRLLRVTARPSTVPDRLMAPLEAYGLAVMSMGFLVDEETPIVWRGKIVTEALTRMLREVAWGELDVLIVDMPPGTGDVQLTMAQTVPLAGAVIVSTPQDLALIDARKGIAMFRRAGVAILGVVENMSTFVCPACGVAHQLFGQGGARREAERIGVPLLGEVPLVMAIRQKSDGGRPIVVSDPRSPEAGIYREIASRLAARLDEEQRLMAGG